MHKLEIQDTRNTTHKTKLYFVNNQKYQELFLKYIHRNVSDKGDETTVQTADNAIHRINR